MSELKKSYYAIIPASVRYDKKLSLLSRLLYGEITALCNEKGFCWAGNAYFAELYEVNLKSISRCVGQLVKNEYITSEMIYRENSKEVAYRYLRLADTPSTVGGRPLHKIVETPMDKNVQDNTTVHNTTENKELVQENILNQWNALANQSNLSAVIKLSDKRKTGINARLQEKEFNLEQIFTEIGRSDFLRGSNGWKVDFDFVFCSANNYLKILEGKYRNGTTQQTVRKSDQTARATFRHTEQDFAENRELTESIRLLRTKRD